MIIELAGGGNQQSSDEIVILYKTKMRQKIFISAHSWRDDAEVR